MKVGDRLSERSSEFRVGSKLYCTQSVVIGNWSTQPAFYSGKYYEIRTVCNVSSYFTLLSDDGRIVIFKMKNNFFINEIELRKLKLGKLNKTYGTAKG